MRNADTRLDPEAGARRRGAGWQAEKSAAMRVEILEGAIRCLVKLGYQGSSTTEIAREAGVSRGAMSHHFKSKDDLIKATVEYLVAKRIDGFRDLLQSRYPDPTQVRAEDRLELYWLHLTDPMVSAFQQLLFAARTDQELEAVMLPAARRFEEEWSAMIKQTMPDWDGLGPRYDLAMDITQFLMEGMAIHTLIDPSPDRYTQLRRYLVDRLADIQTATRGNGDTALHKFLGQQESAPRRGTAGKAGRKPRA